MTKVFGLKMVCSSKVFGFPVHSNAERSHLEQRLLVYYYYFFGCSFCQDLFLVGFVYFYCVFITAFVLFP